MQKLLLALPLLAAACGMSSSGVTAAQVSDLRATAQAASTASTTYGAQASAMPDLPACTADEAGYHGQIAPMIDRMASMGAAMDGQMASMGHMTDGDMACVAAAMAAELARHHGVACASAIDMAPNQAEAAQHVGAMVAWAGHMMDRTGQMGGYMGMGMMGGTGGTVTGHCVHEVDGSYVLQP